MNKNLIQKGFTLIELLIVIAIIAILAAVVFVTLDPLSRFQEARDSTRWSDVASILDAIKVDQVDNGGSYVSAVSTLTAGSNYTIGTCTVGGDSGCSAVTTQAACADLTALSTEGYLGEVPKDPSSGTDALTDYYINKSATGQVTIGACDPEESGATISVSR